MMCTQVTDHKSTFFVYNALIIINWRVRKPMLKIKYAAIFVFCFNVFSTLTINNNKKNTARGNFLFLGSKNKEYVQVYIFLIRYSIENINILRRFFFFLYVDHVSFFLCILETYYEDNPTVNGSLKKAENYYSSM